MTKDKGRRAANDNGTALVWGGTLLVALAIIGVSVFMAMKNRAPEAPSMLPPALIEAVAEPPVEAPAPEPVLMENDIADDIDDDVADFVVPPDAATQAPPEPADDIAVAEPPRRPALQLDNLAGTLQVMLPFMAERDKIPLDHTCYRKNSSPAIGWAGAPAGTKSFVVWLELRPVGAEPYVTWLLFDVPATLAGLPEAIARDERLPDGSAHATADHGNIGYVGPCEARGSFTYALRVFALDTLLGLPPRSSRDDLVRAMNGHIIDAAEQSFIHYYRL